MFIHHLMTELLGTLIELLKKDERFMSSDGEMLKNVVYEAAYKNDTKLLKILYDNDSMRHKFFTKIEDEIEVFNTIEFGWVISNKQFLPDSYTRFVNKIGLTDNNGNFISKKDDVVLAFPHKDCILEGGQTKEDQKKDEIFYNEVLAPDEINTLLAPKVFTNAVRYSKGKKEKVVSIEDKDNIMIKGNNLLVLHSLVKRYKGKVKCIYIDPPYNPTSKANTFQYNNNFNRSTWLTFMKNRLEISKKLLQPTGVLIVAIDKNEQPRLQILIEEIFSDYDVDCITIVHNPRGTIGTNFSYTHEFAIFVTPKKIKTIQDCILDETEVDWSPLRNWGGESLRTDAKNCFYPIIIKNEKIVGYGDPIFDLNIHPEQTEQKGDEYYVYPIDTKGVERKWRYARQTVESITKDLRVKKTKTGFDIELGKRYEMQKTVWVDPKYDASTNGTQLLKRINPDSTFSYPKSLYTVIDCIDAVVRNDPLALVLDFFAGSGTTGHAVTEINDRDNGHRKFILVEQMEYIKTETAPRVQGILKDDESFIYCELSEINQHFVDEVQSSIDDSRLDELYCEITNSPFISTKIKPKDVQSDINDFSALSTENKKRILMKLLDLNMLYVNKSDIDDETYRISEEDKVFNRSFYGDN